MTAAYIKRLVEAYPSIREVWLFGSRANETARENSDWDYWVYANSETLSALTMDHTFRRSDIDLLVVYDGDKFQEPWPSENTFKHGTLSGWKFQRISENQATYKATKLRDGDALDANNFNANTYVAKAIRVCCQYNCL